MSWSLNDTGLTSAEAYDCLGSLPNHQGLNLNDNLILPSLKVPDRGSRQINLFCAFDLLEAVVRQYLILNGEDARRAPRYSVDICEIIFECVEGTEFQKTEERLCFTSLRQKTQLAAAEFLDDYPKAQKAEIIANWQITLDFALTQFQWILIWFDKYFEDAPRAGSLQEKRPANTG